MSGFQVQTPSMCRLVVYTLSEDDAHRITNRRQDARKRTHCWPAANEVHEGDEYPLLVVRVWKDGTVNGTVQLDGEDIHWVTSRPEGTEPGTWHWPERV